MPILLAATLVSGCAERPTVAPIPALRIATSGAPCLVVLLPGRWDRPRDFVRHRFARILADAGIRADVVAVDAHLGYYRKDLLVERLRQDVLAPAVASGRYRGIWVAGNSLGGLGSLILAQELPDTVDGAVALSPWLGDDALITSIRRAGGPRAWATAPVTARAGRLATLWRWLASGDTAPKPRLYLGYGRDDDLARTDALLGSLLPADRVFVSRGGHDWGTWTRLWRTVAARGAVCGGT